MHIRLATMADYHGAEAVLRASLPDNHQYRYAENLRSPSAVNLVAVEGERIVGFITILTNEPNPSGQYLWQRLRPYVGFVGVLSEFRRQKVGTQLMREGAKAVLSPTRQQLWLECSDSRRSFFESLGCVRSPPEAIQQVYGLLPKSNVYSLDHSVLPG
jgi:GNAT superfamily N-acetyltransferase